ncbi:hypothetical protein [Schaalia odontolytica]|uniref:hypothetical protein n=1 Tax=Schaalia odontolytica TaxID=1660 RepID=UPI001D0642BA|nr:hypothetical protein [Schaalia odontolytica]MCB6401988.1 hypothetical protein [Schaalia odontolytica]
MSEDNKNVAGDSERTSILPQSELEAADQTEVLPAHAPETETAQMPPVAQEETGNAFAGTPLECVAGSSIDDQASDEAVAASVATVEPASKKTSWGKRAAIAGAAAAILSVGFGAGIITHAAILGDGEDFYEQGYEDGVSDQGYTDEDEDGESNSGDQQDQNGGPGGGQQRPGNGQQQGPGGQQGPGSGQQQGPGSRQDDTGSTRPGPPPEGGRGPGSTRSSSEDVSGQESDTSAS